MMNSPHDIKLSIIVPVYNVEIFIERCACSLMEQTLQKSIEFIFIDDCSSDESIPILEKTINKYHYRKDQVIIIRNRENKGVTYCRKLGLSVAKGKYIGWCDSDDWVDRNMFKNLYDKLSTNKKDVAICGYSFEHSTYSINGYCKYPSTPQEYIRTLYLHPYILCSLCNTLINKSLYEKTNAFSNISLISGEDCNALLHMLHFAKGWYVCNHVYYHYNRMNQASITTTQTNICKWKQEKENIDNICNFLLSENKKAYKLTCSALKLNAKQYAWNVVPLKEWYMTYKEAYRDIIFFKNVPLLTRVKQIILYSSYFTFYVYHKLHKH